MSNNKQGLIPEITKKLRAQKKQHEHPPPQVGVDSFNVTSVKDYVYKIAALDISRTEKIKLGKKFIAATNTSQKEITYHRNRHPYYKQLKNKNQSTRQNKRNQYNTGKKTRWSREKLLALYDLNKINTDLELAERFDCSVPSINAIRRRINVIHKLVEQKYIKDKDIFVWIERDERTLKKLFTKNTKKGLT